MTHHRLVAPVTAEHEVKRSRFVCDLAPAETEEQARAVIQRVRAANRDARHHCTAFVIGEDHPTERSNDDGEPSGTAGVPMLEVLRGNEIRNVVAVVTRWFGGVLLGTGGLARAYAESVTGAVSVARSRQLLLPRRRSTVFEVRLPIDVAARAENALHALPWALVGEASWAASQMAVTVACAPHHAEALASAAAAASGGRARLSTRGERWTDAPS